MSHKNYIASLEKLLKAQTKTIQCLKIENKSLEFELNLKKKELDSIKTQKMTISEEFRSFRAQYYEKLTPLNRLLERTAAELSSNKEKDY